MCTRIKRLVTAVKDKCSKIDIRNHKKLLWAAVILFCSFIAIFSPLKGIEHLIFLKKSNNNNNQESFVAKKPQIVQSAFSANGLYLTANSLACITNPVDNDSDNQVNGYINEESSLIVVQKSALVNRLNPVTFVSQQPREEITTYVVQEGDTIIGIAAIHGITTNTLLWANELTGYSIIRPGDELTIPPISGVIHRVKDGDTIGAIASKYNAKSDTIITFNDLPADGSISIGEKLIIPDGQMPAAPKPKSTYSEYSYASVSGPGTGKSHAFPWGQCTWYAAQKRYVPWSGHAKYWLDNARAYGYQTGTAPQAGAIVVLSEGGWMGRLYGHVAYVESVKNGWVTISEMNYRCLGCRSVRTLSMHDKSIRGYIY
ncbi:MAG: LysM peptidoglycan-binding domain-containing protein [bacterium]